MDASDIKQRLAGISDVLAGVLDPDHSETGLVVEVLKSSDHAAALKLRLGYRTGFLKLFNLDASAAGAFDRERKALELLQGNQVPRLLLVAEAERAIMTDFIDGTTLLDNLRPQTLMSSAEHLGQWFGRLSNAAPHEAQQSTWADYLENYSHGFDLDILHQQTAILHQTPISRLVLAHNDNTLGNFILAKDKRLYAVDFESSRMKPEGWDLLTSARALFGRFPEGLTTISQSLLRGYQLAAKDCQLPPHFDQVINVLALSMAAAKP